MILENIIGEYVEEKNAGLMRDLLFRASKAIYRGRKTERALKSVVGSRGAKSISKSLFSVSKPISEIGAKETPYLTENAARVGMKLRNLSPEKYHVRGSSLGKYVIKPGATKAVSESGAGIQNISETLVGGESSLARRIVKPGRLDLSSARRSTKFERLIPSWII